MKMNAAEIKDYVQWDVKTWSKALKYWEENIDWSKIENALELGAREGGLSLWLSSKSIETTCSDYMDTKERATPLHAKYGSPSNIHYQDIDATNILYENHFDLIVFKSIVGGIAQGDHIEIQQKVFDEIYKALKPGGILLFAENLTSTKLHQKLRARHNAWGNYWRYISLKELSVFLNKFSSIDVKTTGVLGTFGRGEKQKNFLAGVDKVAVNHFTPSSWKYLGYGLAKK